MRKFTKPKKTCADPHHKHPHPPSGSEHHDQDHGHAHSLQHAHQLAPRAILKAMAVTVLFMLIETAGGILSNSLALLSDAAHMLTDVGALLLSLFAIWVSRRPYSNSMSFGYHRAEILGALASGLGIWLIAGMLVYEAFHRLSAPPEVQGKMVFIIATLGLLANLMGLRILLGASKESINVKAAYLHMLSDTLGSIGAIVAGLGLWLTGWRLIDPLITLLFSVLMLKGSWSLIKDAVSVLMEMTPQQINPIEIKEKLLTIAGVKEIHDLHIWSVSIDRLALSVHLIATENDNVLATANELLKNEYGILHTTIQIEHPEKFRFEGCYDCDTAIHTHP